MVGDWLRPVYRAGAQLTLVQRGAVAEPWRVPLRAWYPIEVFDFADDARASEDMASDEHVSDTRLVDALARLQHTGELSIPVPDIVDDTAYAVECAALGEADFVRSRRTSRISKIGSPLSKRSSGRVRLDAAPSSPTPALASAAMTDTELHPHELAPAPESGQLQPVQRVERVTTISPAPALAAPRRPRAVALPRAARVARLARRRGPLQADVDRRRVGDPAAVPDDGRLHARLREVREASRRTACRIPIFSYSALLPWTYFASSVALSSASLVSNRTTRHEGLLPARAAAARRRHGADRRLPLRVDRALRDDGLVPGVADLGGRARSCVPLHGARHGARRRALPLGRQRALPRRAVRDPVRPPALALRLRRRVRDQRAARAVAVAPRTQPDDCGHQRVPVGRCSARRHRDLGKTLVSIAAAVAFFVVGLWYFRRSEPRFADTI